jgi:arylsulfatase A
MNYTQIRIALVVIFVCNALFLSVSGASAAPPHIVVILADDLGWGDPQCYQPDSKIPTPNIDRLAQEGVRFTNAHPPSSVSTPTRYSLLTVRYCWRTKLQRGVLDRFDPPLLTSDDETIASLCRRAGYFTACVGKWHWGMNWFNRDGSPVSDRGPQRFRPGDEVDFERDITGGPLDTGFDHYFEISASLDMSPYAYLHGRRVETLPTERHEEVQNTLFLNGVPGVKSWDFSADDDGGKKSDGAPFCGPSCS